jgi:hypothetical protein
MSFPGVSYSGGNSFSPGSIAVADVNGDGYLDVIAANGNNSTVDVLLGNGDGTFRPQLTNPVGFGASSLVVGDLNGDGYTDLIVSNSGANTISILLGNGDGTFKPQQTYAVGAQPSGSYFAPYLALGDFNDDGKLDIIVESSADRSLNIFIGNGDGTFQTVQPVATIAGAGALAVGDFNGDGFLDVAVVNGPSTTQTGLNQVAILLGKGNGTFQTPTEYPGQVYSGFVAVGDFNGDGKPDLAVSDIEGVSVFLGNGDGTFQAGTHFIAGDGILNIPSQLLVGDFDVDGKDDVAISLSSATAILENNGEVYTGGGGLAVLYGNGDGTLQPVKIYDAGDWRAIAMGDLNGDGRMDLVMASPANSSVYALLNEWTVQAVANQIFALGGPATHSILSSYPGDANYKSNTSNSVSLVRGISTALTLTASPSGNLQAGQTVQLTAVLAPTTYGGIGVSGTLSFYDNGALIYSQTIGASGQVTFTTAALGTGGHSFTAGYAGDSTFAPAVSGVQVVWATSSTTTSLAVSSNSVAAGSPVTFTAAVAYQGNTPLVGGQVQFCDTSATSCVGDALLGTAQTNTSGKASFSSRLGIGSYNIEAMFIGNASGSSSASTPQAVTVSGQLATSTVLTQSGVPGRYTLVADVTGSGHGEPTGSVTFEDTSNGNSTVATGQLSNTTATELFAGSSIATGNSPRSVAWADLNGDGKPDLVVANRYDNTVSVLLGNGDGTFQTQVTHATGVQPTSVSIGDFNGDGKLDLAISNLSDNTVSVLLGNGDGTFQTQKTYSTGAEPGMVSLADFNGDGKLDLAVANYGDNTVGVLLGNGDGTFKAQMAYSVGVQPACLSVGDLNGDDRPDIVSCDSADNTISVLLGNGDGTFEPRVTYKVGYTPYSAAIADLNGDGKQDVVVVNSTLDVVVVGGSQTNPISVFLGNGDGTLQAAKTYGVGQEPISIVVSDFNDDGKPDVAVANRLDNTVSVLFGNGDGTFQPQVVFPTGKEPTSLAAPDLNGDGRPDLVVANFNDTTLSALLNQVEVSVTASNVAIIGPSAAHTVVAAYSGDSVYLPSTSNTVSLTSIPKTTPSVTAAASPNSITAAQGFTVTVTVAGTPTPTGSVSLASGSYTSAATALDGSGTATVNVPGGSLPVGSDTLTASYTPDSASSSIYNNASGTASVTVTAKTTPTMTVSPSSNTITTAQPLTVTVTLAGTPTPTGSVTLSSGNYTSTAATLGGGIATINVLAGSLAVGSDTLTASYTPDSASSSIYNNASGTASVTVTTVVNPTFTISGTAITVAPGATTGNTSVITVTPSGGFTGSVALTAALTSSPAGAQYPPTLSFGSTTPVSITGTTAATASLTVSTTAATSAALAYPKSRRPPWYAAGGAALAALLFFGIPVRRRSWRAVLGMLLLLVALGGGVLACGGGGSGGSGGGGGGGTGNSGTTAGAYTVTITGTSGGLTQNTTVTVTVN